MFFLTVRKEPSLPPCRPGGRIGMLYKASSVPQVWHFLVCAQEYGQTVFFCSKHGIPTMKHICKTCLSVLGWTQSWLWAALPFQLLEEITISGPFKEAWARVGFWRLSGPILTCVSAYTCKEICRNACSDHGFLHIHHNRALTNTLVHTFK